jgi:selenocysteine lyase/cysteine desulfurase
MTHRRNFLKTVSAAPLLARAASAQTQSAAPIPGLPRPGDPAYWDQVRDQFLLARDKVFFNNGTIGAMPRVVLDRTVEHLRKMAIDVADWDYRGENWIGGYDSMIAVRSKAARLLNADTNEIALTENVTCANSYVAAGIDLEPGAEILMSDQEHPGGYSPWLNAAKRHNGSVVQMALPKPAHNPGQILEIARQSFTPRTRVLFLSQVVTGSGAILPVKEICAEARARGIFTVIDGAQAFGHIPVDVRDIGCDAYVSCFHKWLLAPAGNGVLYVRGARADSVWATLCSANWNNHADNGLRFTQRGTGSMSLLVGLDAALDFHNAIGAARVHERVKYLGDYLRAGLRKLPNVKIYSPDDPAMCAGITVYSVNGVTGPQLQDEMWKRERLRPRSSGAGVRHCTHIFNSPAEIDRALEVCRKLG